MILVRCKARDVVSGVSNESEETQTWLIVPYVLICM